jgi:hypothetical protein
MTSVAALIGAWLPFLFAWVIFTMTYGGVTVADALPRSLVTIGSAALLGIAATAFCSRLQWPDKLRWTFYAKHAAGSAVYAACWIVVTYACDRLLGGMPFWLAISSSRVLGWQFLMGVWLYGLIAGVTYSLIAQRRALEAEAGLAAARLDALRSRLNPHFLFNALHTVAALVRHDAAQAENAIEKLGDILRYTLQETKGDAVSFGEEWEFTRRYIEFEQLRYGTRLHVTSEIDNACLSCLSPAFALQTLVENAVQHSISTRPEGGRIEIGACTKDDRLHVRVRDDGGDGFTSAHRGSRYGLPALRERLRAVHGDAAEVAVASTAGAYEVSFTIPCRVLLEDRADE